MVQRQAALQPGWTRVVTDTNGNRVGVADVFGPERGEPMKPLGNINVKT